MGANWQRTRSVVAREDCRLIHTSEVRRSRGSRLGAPRPGPYRGYSGVVGVLFLHGDGSIHVTRISRAFHPLARLSRSWVPSARWLAPFSQVPFYAVGPSADRDPGIWTDTPKGSICILVYAMPMARAAAESGASRATSVIGS
jgi:hypothetical protein